MTQQTQSIFTRPAWVVIFALTAAMVWGWAYPLIKLGFREFEITADMTASKMLFAGIRFCISGLIILSIAKLTHRDFSLKKTSERRIYTWLYLLLFALLNTTIHYAFFYFGLSHSEGARAAIINSMGVFATVILACMFFKSDKFTARKISVLGILSLNLGGVESGRFTWLGDGMIMLNALCSAGASLMTRGVGQRIDVFIGTGISLGMGGALLILPALFLGGTLQTTTLWGVTILMLLIGISTIGFTLYNKLLTCNPVGKVAIYNSLIPVIGTLSSCLCLGETFYWKYIIAGTLATSGIYIINKGK